MASLDDTDKKIEEPARPGTNAFVGSPRRIGRPPRRDNPVKYNVTLPLELGEWAKEQEGGMSRLITDLLRKERDRRERKQS